MSCSVVLISNADGKVESSSDDDDDDDDDKKTDKDTKPAPTGKPDSLLKSSKRTPRLSLNHPETVVSRSTIIQRIAKRSVEDGTHTNLRSGTTRKVCHWFFISLIIICYYSILILLQLYSQGRRKHLKVGVCAQDPRGTFNIQKGTFVDQLLGASNICFNG